MFGSVSFVENFFTSMEQQYSLCCGYIVTFGEGSLNQNVCANCKKVVTKTRGKFDTQEVVLLTEIKNKLQEILEAINSK